jgi:hypothetical protein
MQALIIWFRAIVMGAAFLLFAKLLLKTQTYTWISKLDVEVAT